MKQKEHGKGNSANLFLALWIFVLVLNLALAQEATTSRTDQTFTTKIINVWPGVAAGSEKWRQPKTVIGSVGNRRVMNVSTSTLTAYLPDPSTATGTAVIIAGWRLRVAID